MYSKSTRKRNLLDSIIQKGGPGSGKKGHKTVKKAPIKGGMTAKDKGDPKIIAQHKKIIETWTKISDDAAKEREPLLKDPKANRSKIAELNAKINKADMWVRKSKTHLKLYE